MADLTTREQEWKDRRMVPFSLSRDEAIVWQRSFVRDFQANGIGHLAGRSADMAVQKFRINLQEPTDG